MRPIIALVGLFLLPVLLRSAPLDPRRLERIDEAVQRSLQRGDCPGAVVLIVHNDEIAYRKAFGYFALQPKKKAMTADAVFDMASLTKPIATATSIWILIEQGKLRLADRVTRFWPEFGNNKKDSITIAQLLLHTSGLTADNALADYKEGKKAAMERIAALKLEAEPGARFRYSDVGFIVLGELVERISGEPVDAFAKKHVFEPLRMRDTGYKPDGKTKERSAPTGKRDGQWLIGEVHDPRAALLDGVAGHAGLFSTADDLARYARMLLRGGELDGRRILSPLTVQRMTEGNAVPNGKRSYGWDVDTAFSSPRGELFAKDQGFGHTGFTGTSIWIDPPSRTAVIILTNRVHISEKVQVTQLRREVATIVASAVRSIENPKTGFRPVETGIDALVGNEFEMLRGKSVGLVTNHTGRDRQGRATIDLLHQAKGMKLVALFSPEHGIRGELDQSNIGDSKDARTGLPVYSLYGKRRKPDAETLKGIDTLVYDIQDIGCRFYTYISTLGLILEAAAEHKIRVVVLDRPNPIGGLVVDGPVRDEGKDSFIAWHTLPVRHGMTVGELAKMFVAEKKLPVELEVAKVEGWKRGDFFDRTGLTWVNPSPNMRSLTQAYLYPGIGLLETTNLSVGRGTDRPFEWIGAPWLDGARLSETLNRLGLPGVRFVPTALTPASSVHQGKLCSGVQIIIDDWRRFNSLRTGLTIAVELRKQHPEDWAIKNYNRLLLHQATFEAVQAGKNAAEIENGWQPTLRQFVERRKQFLLYDE